MRENITSATSSLGGCERARSHLQVSNRKWRNKGKRCASCVFLPMHKSIYRYVRVTATHLNLIEEPNILYTYISRVVFDVVQHGGVSTVRSYVIVVKYMISIQFNDQALQTTPSIMSKTIITHPNAYEYMCLNRGMAHLNWSEAVSNVSEYMLDIFKYYFLWLYVASGLEEIILLRQLIRI